AADKTRIAGGQGGIGLAGGAALVVGRYSQPRLGDAGSGGGLSEGVIAGISAAQAQSRDVDGLVGAHVFVGKRADSTGGAQSYSVATDDSCQRGAGSM